MTVQSYIKGPAQPLFDIISRNDSEFNLVTAKTKSEKLNNKLCSSKEYYKYLGMNASDIEKVPCDLLYVMKYSASEWPANTCHNSFRRNRRIFFNIIYYSTLVLTIVHLIIQRV